MTTFTRICRPLQKYITNFHYTKRTSPPQRVLSWYLTAASTVKVTVTPWICRVNRLRRRPINPIRAVISQNEGASPGLDRPPHAPSAHEKTNGTSCGLIARGRDAGACAKPSSLAPGICTRALPKFQKRGHLLKFFYYFFFYCSMFIKLRVLYYLHVYMLQNWFPMLQFLSSRLHIQ